MRARILLTLTIAVSAALCVPAPAGAADEDQNPNECVSVISSRGKSQMENQCDFKINVRWKDDATCPNWTCTGSIAVRSSIVIPSFNLIIAFRACKHPQKPSADNDARDCR